MKKQNIKLFIYTTIFSLFFFTSCSSVKTTSSDNESMTNNKENTESTNMVPKLIHQEVKPSEIISPK